jgi:CIC family chloride channel protein
VTATKLAGGLLALTAGFSLGREGPTVQVGAATGKLVGQGLRAPRRSLNTLVAAGAGAGLAGAFNAPLAGFLFVMEELKREMSPMTYGTAFIGSVCAVLVTRAFSGQSPSFLLPESNVLPFDTLLPAALLGVTGGIAGVLFNHGLLRATSLRPRIPGPRWLPAAFTGAVAGVLLLTFPRITGVGHGLAGDILSGNLHARHLVLLALALFAGKFLLTILSYGTGVPGGIFAPMLVMGSCLGFAFGILGGRLFPTLGISPTVFATIGMAAFLTGSVRAPLTAVVLIVEMTNEYNLLFALLLGCFFAYATAELLRSEPIYEALLQRELRVVEEGRPDATGVSQFEVLVEPDSLLADRRLRDLDFPPGARVTAIARHGRDVIPHGETRLESGDLITVMIEERAAEAAARIVEGARGM